MFYLKSSALYHSLFVSKNENISIGNLDLLKLRQFLKCFKNCNLKISQVIKDGTLGILPICKKLKNEKVKKEFFLLYLLKLVKKLITGKGF